MREAPENPGGKATENQGLNVTQVAAMENPPVAETIVLAPVGAAIGGRGFTRRLSVCKWQRSVATRRHQMVKQNWRLM